MRAESYFPFRIGIRPGRSSRDSSVPFRPGRSNRDIKSFSGRRDRHGRSRRDNRSLYSRRDRPGRSNRDIRSLYSSRDRLHSSDSLLRREFVNYSAARLVIVRSRPLAVDDCNPRWNSSLGLQYIAAGCSEARMCGLERDSLSFHPRDR